MGDFPDFSKEDFERLITAINKVSYMGTEIANLRTDVQQVKTSLEHKIDTLIEERCEQEELRVSKLKENYEGLATRVSIQWWFIGLAVLILLTGLVTVGIDRFITK